MSTSTVHPKTFEQIQTTIVDWFGDVAKGREIPVSFSQPSKSSKKASEQLCFYSTPSKDFRVETKDQCVLLQLKDRRLTVFLDDFIISSAFDDRRLCLNIARDPKPEHRVLMAALKAAAETKHPIFLSRALRVFRTLEEDLSVNRIEEATAAPSDWEVVLDAFAASSWSHQLAIDDPLAAAKLRGIKKKQQLIEEAGGTLTSEGVAERLGITRQAVDKRRGANQLLALTQGKRGYSYPVFQFAEDRTLNGLETVLQELKDLDPWMQMIFFASPNERFDGHTAIKALQSGRIEQVVLAARGYGEQGAP